MILNYVKRRVISAHDLLVSYGLNNVLSKGG